MIIMRVMVNNFFHKTTQVCRLKVNNQHHSTLSSSSSVNNLKKAHLSIQSAISWLKAFLRWRQLPCFSWEDFRIAAWASDTFAWWCCISLRNTRARGEARLVPKFGPSSIGLATHVRRLTCPQLAHARGSYDQKCWVVRRLRCRSSMGRGHGTVRLLAFLLESLALWLVGSPTTCSCGISELL